MDKFRAKDGQYYDTLEEKFSANIAWDEKMAVQERQNALLEQQNRLIQQQNELNYKLEQEKIQKNYELEMNKLQHQEKMRLLSLFDNIGISKETYDLYVNTNFSNETTKDLLQQKEDTELLASKYDFLLHSDEKQKELGWDTFCATMNKYDMYALKNSLLERYGDRKDEDHTEEIEQLESKKKSYKTVEKWCIVIMIISIIIICPIVTLIIFVGIIFMKFCYIKYIDEKIENLQIPDYTYDYNKYNTKLKSLIKQEEAKVNKLTEKIKNNCQDAFNDLYDFRIKHYNSSVEKLLIDVGFKELVENYGFEYKKINNSNKKSDGTIEDYIEYFETNS